MCNFDILKPEVQDFIKKNWQASLAPLILKGSPFPTISIQEIAQQLKGKKKAQKKLPHWFSSENILYPPAINLEQSSSEITAKYKAALISGKTLIDLTGGFGIDDVYFAEKIAHVTYCELHKNLSQLAAHNFKQLSSKNNIQFCNGDGLKYLENQTKKYDWLYADPSRRDHSGSKVFRLEDCEPAILENLGFLLEKSAQILIKTSPLLDLDLGVKQLQYVTEIHIIAVKNEVKELLWILKKNPSIKAIPIKTINFGVRKTEKFHGFFAEKNAHTSEIRYKKPATYLYEPNAAIMKSGLFSTLSHQYTIGKLAKNSHLFTSAEMIDFPGRRFKILHTHPYHKKTLKRLNFEKANITTRNFPISVKMLRKKFRIKEGGAVYLFFTTDLEGQKIVVQCEKIKPDHF